MKYRQSIENWRAGRNECIRRENGWLALAGLFWLEPGKSQIGSGSKCEIQLPNRLPARVGYLEYDGSVVSMQINPGQQVEVNGEIVEYAILRPDISDNPSFVTLEEVRFVVIERGHKMGVRVWDNRREERKTFPARIWFDIDERFRLPAIYTAYEHPKQIIFPDVTGETSDFPVEGYLSFEFNGKRYELDVNMEDDGSLFMRFWDPTGRDETYPTGRYLIVEKEEGEYVIDFNRAYNPPCSFTPFATCVFAPEQNRLDFRVNAGERYSKG